MIIIISILIIIAIGVLLVILAGAFGNHDGGDTSILWLISTISISYIIIKDVFLPLIDKP